MIDWLCASFRFGKRAARGRDESWDERLGHVLEVVGQDEGCSAGKSEL